MSDQIGDTFKVVVLGEGKYCCYHDAYDKKIVICLKLNWLKYCIYQLVWEKLHWRVDSASTHLMRNKNQPLMLRISSRLWEFRSQVVAIRSTSSQSGIPPAKRPIDLSIPSTTEELKVSSIEESINQISLNRCRHCLRYHWFGFIWSNERMDARAQNTIGR